MCKFLLGLTWGIALGVFGGVFATAYVEMQHPERYAEFFKNQINDINKDTSNENSVEIEGEE